MRPHPALLLILFAAGAMAFYAAGPLRSFERVMLLEETSENSASVSLGDVNGDGRLDIILAKGRHGPLHSRVLINDGKGGYAAHDLAPSPARTYSAALADIDGDGDLDVILSNDSPDRKLVYKNDGRGRFAESGTFGDRSWNTRYVTLADLNGDKFPDIVAANRGGDQTVPSYICWNDRKGNFPSCDPLPPGSSTSIAVADLDGDGAADLFVPHRDGGQSVVLWNDGKGRFSTATKVGPANTAARIGVAADFNGDRRLDLAYIDEARKATFVMVSLGARQFGDPVQLPGSSAVPYALAAADLNRDGLPDLIVGFVGAPGIVYFNQGGGTNFTPVAWNDGKGDLYGMAFTDIDGDGWPDIVAARSGAPNAIWFSAPHK